MKYYKVLNSKGECINGGKGKWYLPTKWKDGTWKPGKWMPVIDGELIACRHGYHLCRPTDLIYWLNESIFEAEFTGECVEEGDKLVVRKARLVRKIENWNEKTARLFACDCAEHVLPIFEKQYPDDKRPRHAIETARKFALGTATQDELAARDAARDAARAARDAARAAAWAAGDAAWDAGDAGDVARAARAAAWAAGDAGDAENKWQAKILLKIINK